MFLKIINIRKAPSENFWNGVHLEDDEEKDLEIRGCRNERERERKRERGEGGIGSLEWVEKEGWRRKIRLYLQAQKHVKKIKILYININYYYYYYYYNWIYTQL